MCLPGMERNGIGKSPGRGGWVERLMPTPIPSHSISRSTVFQALPCPKHHLNQRIAYPTCLSSSHLIPFIHSFIHPIIPSPAPFLLSFSPFRTTRSPVLHQLLPSLAPRPRSPPQLPHQNPQRFLLQPSQQPGSSLRL